MRKHDQIVKRYPDNIRMTAWAIHDRADVARAFEGSSYELDPDCRVQWVERGRLATCRAGGEPWVVIAWGTLSRTERQTWFLHWWSLEEGKR